MTQRKKLIEVALPLEAINAASAAQKGNPFLKQHPRRLHLWWARRPLAAARAVIFTSLVDDPDDENAPSEFVEACRRLPSRKNALVEDTPRQRLFDFIETLVQWDSMFDDDVLETANKLIRLSTDGNPPPLLDPFAGGGSIPLEAHRLGLEAHASDLNPVAVMINKAQIEIPPRFANIPPVNSRDQSGTAQGMSWTGAKGMAADVRFYGNWVSDQAWERIGHLYPKGPNGKTVIAWLWARTVRCPNPACGSTIPLVKSFWLSKKKGQKAWIQAEIDRFSKQVHFHVNNEEGSPSEGTVGRKGVTCPVCGESTPFDYVRSEGRSNRLKDTLLAVVTSDGRGISFCGPTPEQEQIARVSLPNGKPNTDLPEHALGFRVQLYGIDQHHKLFTARQLTALTTFSELVAEVRDRIYHDAISNGMADDKTPLREGGKGAQAYSEAISVYLAFAISRWTDYVCTLCTWNTKNQNIAHVFGLQTLSITWDFAEANVFGSQLSFDVPIEWIATVLDSLTISGNIGVAEQQDAQKLQIDRSVVVSTDPPYYDNVGYADLSDFFYVWLRPILEPIYPEIFGTVLVPKEAELVVDYQEFESREAANTYFEQGLQQAFTRIRGVSHSDYPVSVYYAFKQLESQSSGTAAEQVISNTGWEVMLEGLISSGFVIAGTWPMRTERPGRLRETGSNALASSIVLVCRPRPDDAPQTSRREFVNALRRELPEALRDMQSGSIAPVDLAQASIGPGMAIYSRYRRVLEADGSPMTVRTALQLINQELDAYLAETEGDVDTDTRFCINWFEQFGFNEGEFGVADVLARAKNTSVDGLVNAGVLVAGAGKVKLLHWQEVEPGWTPQEDSRVTVWEAVTHLIERINTHGETGSAALLLRMDSDLAAEAKNLAYRLYQICERKGWADHALDYNALVVSWPGLQERANELKQDQPPEQLGLL